jgi:hypothetical protein
MSKNLPTDHDQPKKTAKINRKTPISTAVTLDPKFRTSDTSKSPCLATALY